MDDDELEAVPAPATAVRTPPSAFMRFLVVVFGVLFFGMGRAVQSTGGPFALVVGVLLQLVGIAVFAIAIGLVERLLRGRRAG